MLMLGYNGYSKTYLLRDKTGGMLNVSREKIIELARNHMISNVKLHGRGLTKCELRTHIRNFNKTDKDKLLTFLNNSNDVEHSDTRLYKIISGSNWNELRELRVGLHGNKYECIFIPGKLGNVTIFDGIELPEMERSLIEYISILSKQVNNSVFTLQHYYDIPCTFSYVDMRSTVDPDYRYSTYFSHITEYPSTVLRDAYEKAMFGDANSLTLDKVLYKCIDSDEYNNYIQGIRFKLGYSLGIDWINTCNNYSMAGFTYLKGHSITSGKKYLCAIYNNKIVGVVYFGVWGTNPYQSVSYIDICKPYRNKGIANALVNRLNKYLDKSLPLVLTELSELGREAKMDIVFKNGIKVVKVYSYQDALEHSKDFVRK